MLEILKLQNVGPAPELELACHPRVNLVTGDNGLGKTFLLDTAWWSLTGHWPHDVNPRLTVGFPATPRDPEVPAAIETGILRSGRAFNQTATWSRVVERWARDFPGPESLVIYAHADGSMSVWDPLRNYPGGDEFDNWAIMLFDEVESHLHPRWQRTILGSLRNLGTTLLDNVSMQLL